MIETKSAVLFAAGSLVSAIGVTQADIAMIAGGIATIGWAGVSLYSRQKRQRIDDEAYRAQKEAEQDVLRRERYASEREGYLKESREEIHRLRDELQVEKNEKELMRKQLWDTTRELDRWRKNTPDPDRTP